MSVYTRRAGGGWTSVSTSGYYNSTVANYAAALKQAQEQQDNTELEEKIFAYKEGLLPFSELSEYLNNKIKLALPKSQKELDLRQLLAEANEYEVDKNRELKRAELEKQFIKDGISASERVAIESEMLQYYKAGTPEFAQQQTAIAAAKEAERVSLNKAKVAQLEARLSEGGLSAGEAIEIKEEQLKFVEPGSVEEANINSDIENLKVRKEQDDKEAEEARRVEQAMQVQSDMLDELIADDGTLSSEDQLKINLAMQEFFESGSENYIRLKEQEADIRDAILKESKAGSGAGSKQAREALEAQYEAAVGEVDRAFLDKELSGEQYLTLKSQLAEEKKELFEQGLVAFDQADLIELESEQAQLREQLDDLNSGRRIVVISKSGKTAGQPVIVLNDPDVLGQFAEDVKSGVAALDAQGNPRVEKVVINRKGEEVRTPTTIDDPEGTMVTDPQARVITTINSRGEQVTARINEGGKLEVLAPQSTISGSLLIPTGQVLGAGKKKLQTDLPAGQLGESDSLQGLQSTQPQMTPRSSKYDNSPAGRFLQAVDDGRIKIGPDVGANHVAKVRKQYAEGRRSLPEGDEKKFAGVLGTSVAENKQFQIGEAQGVFGTPFTKLFTQPKGGEDAVVKTRNFFNALESLGRDPVSIGKEGIQSVLDDAGSGLKSLGALGQFSSQIFNPKPGDVPDTVDTNFSEILEPFLGEGQEGAINLDIPLVGRVNVPDFGVFGGKGEGIGKIKSITDKFKSFFNRDRG